MTTSIAKLTSDNDKLDKSTESMTQAKNGMDETVGGLNPEISGLKTSLDTLTKTRTQEKEHDKTQIRKVNSEKAELATKHTQLKTLLKNAERELRELKAAHQNGDALDPVIVTIVHTDQ